MWSVNKLVSRACLGVMLLCFTLGVQAKKTIKIDPAEGDMTLIVREALEGISDSEVKLVFTQGTYRFFPEYAISKYCYITNHGNGMKRIIFDLEGFESVEIEGNGASFIFHGQVFPFRFSTCNQVIVHDLSIDWDIPFCFQGEVMATNAEEGWRDIKPFTKGFSWQVKKGRLTFPNIDGFAFTSLGSSLAFDPETGNVAHGVWDMSSRPRWVEKRPSGILRFHEKLKHYPPIGSILNSKGPKGPNRYAPAFQVISARNVQFEKVIVHHALGMGFLMERTENATLTGCGVYVQEGSDRVVSTIADATHFCNCKGDILIEDCVFKHMLDDGTNVHGTYVAVDKKLDDHTVRVELMHFEQMGFEFAGEGDEIWFIHQPNPDRASINEVKSVSQFNDQFIDLTCEKPLPENLAKGDILENKTWNPTFTMRGCTIREHRARNIVLKTPLKIVIEDNDFSSMMSSVFFRGETFYWFESGGVADVLIRNNRFEYCAYSGMEHAVLRITPRLGKTFDQEHVYDRNIRFEDNVIKTFDNRIVWADRVEGLTISGNKIIQTQKMEPLRPDAHLFEFTNCKDVKVINNRYKGSHKKAVKADEATEKSMTVKKNTGF